MAESDQPNSENNQKSSHEILTSFFCALVICCVLYGGAIFLHNGHIVEGQNRIIRTYNRQMKQMEAEKMTMNMRDSQREKEFSTFHQEVKTLLELEYNRIQNEFEAIEIWTGILTVIFLIFSFYSLFKTEQLENQSRDELLKLKKMYGDGQTMLAELNGKGTTTLGILESSSERIKTDAEEKISSLIGKKKTDELSDFDKRAKDILETYMTQIKEMLSTTQKSINNDYEIYLKKLQSIMDKDFYSSDSDEEELDEEELKKDQENEGKEN